MSIIKKKNYIVISICKLKKNILLNEKFITENCIYQNFEKAIAPSLTKSLRTKKNNFLVNFFRKMNLNLDKAITLITVDHLELVKIFYCPGKTRQLVRINEFKSTYKMTICNKIDTVFIAKTFFVCLGLVNKTKIKEKWRISQSDFVTLVGQLFLVISFAEILNYSNKSNLKFFPKNAVDHSSVINCNAFIAALQVIFDQPTEQDNFFCKEFIEATQNLLVSAKIITKTVELPTGVEYEINADLNLFFLNFSEK